MSFDGVASNPLGERLTPESAACDGTRALHNAMVDTQPALKAIRFVVM